MAKAKLFAPGVAAPFKAPKKPAVDTAAPAQPDPARVQTELAITALAKGGFEEKDKAGQIAPGAESLLRLQQLAGNEFVTKMMTAPAGSPVVEGKTAKPEEAQKTKPAIEAKAAEKTTGPAKPAKAEREGEPAVQPVKQADAAKAPGTVKDTKAAPKAADPAKEAKKEGAASLPLPTVGNAKDAVKPVKTPVQAPAAAGGGSGAGGVTAWKGKVAKAASEIPPKKVAGGKGSALTDAASKSAAKTKGEAEKLPEEGSKAIDPAKKPPDVPAIPEDISGAALKRVDEKTKRKLADVTLPAMAASPLNHMPEIGKEPPKKVPAGDAAKAQPEAPKKDQGAAAEKDKKDQPVVKPPEAEQKKALPGPATIKDEPPPAVEIPEGKRVNTGDVVARLLVSVGKHAKRIVDDARAGAFGGVLKEAWPDIGAGFVTDEAATVDTELRNVAAAVGAGKEILDKKIEERRKELDESEKKAEGDLNKSLDTARKTQAESRSTFLGALTATRDSLEKSAQDRAALVKGGVDPEKVRKERDALIAAVDQKAGTWTVNYEDAGKKFKENLDTEAGKQIRAYKVAAQEDEDQLNADAAKRAGDDPNKKEQEAAAARTAYRTTKYWLDEQSAAIRTFVEKAKIKVDDQVTGFTGDLNTAATAARNEIRDSAAKRLGYERSWFQRLLDWVVDWLNQAKVQAEAWAAKRTADNKAAAEKDNEFLDAELAKLSKMSKEEVQQEVSKLNDEQFAIVKAYFESGGDRVEAVAAGLITHLSAQHRPELIKRFESEVLASTDLEKVTKVGQAQTPGFDPVKRSDGLRKAFAGPGTVEEDVFANLGGMTPIQARAVELQYNRDWAPETLRGRLKSELDDWATWSKHDINRANALLSGDPAMAAAIQLNQAMHGNWNGLDLGGTDEDTVFSALRNKSPSEVAAIKKAYLETYGVPLETDLKGELDYLPVGGKHDFDRAQALLESDTIKADAIAADKAMHGGWLGLGVGTDRKAIEDVYAQMDAELEQEAEAKGWDSAKLKFEKSKRRKALDAKYEQQYGGDLKGLKRQPGQSLLSAAFEDEMSGAELRLIQGIHDQNDIKANAAKVRIEHDSIIYADDKVINDATQASYRNEYKDQKRDLNLAIDEKLEAAKKAAYAQGDPNLFYKEYTPDKIRDMRSEAAKTAMQNAQAASADNFDKLETEYNTQYAGKMDSIFGKPSLSFREDIKLDTQGAANDKAQKLIDQKGYLTEPQEIRYAVQGLGTGDEAKATLKGKSKKEIEKLKTDWASDPELAKLGTLEGYVLGTGLDPGDYSGREYREMKEMLDYGEPQTPEERLAKAKRDLVAETSWRNPWLAENEYRVLKGRVDALEQKVSEFKAFEAKKGDDNFDWKKYSDLQGEVDARAAHVDSAVSVHQHEVDVISDTATQVIGAVVTALIVAVAVIADVLTAGGAAAATPAEAAGISALWAALGISLAGTALTMITKAVIKGDAYGWEESGEDLAIGLVDALISLPTGGMGGKLLKGGGMLAKLAEKKLFGKLLANFLANAAEGAVQSLPGAVLGNALNKQNYQGGNAILNILEGSAVQTLSAAALSGGVGVLHVAVQTDLARIRTNPEYQERIFEKFRAKNPGATKEQFLTHLDNLIIARTDKGFKNPKLQEDLHQRLTQHLPADQKAFFRDVPIEVLPEAQFQALTGSTSGKAVTLIVDGKPVVVSRAGVTSLELSAEGFHLLQSKEPVFSEKMKLLDESNQRNWAKKDIETQFRMYEAKLDLEIDANQRFLGALEERQNLAQNPAEVAAEIHKTKTNLENLKQRQREVAAVGPEQKLKMTNDAKLKPAYLDQPPRLFTKDPALPKPKQQVAPKVEKTVPSEAAKAEAAPPEKTAKPLEPPEGPKAAALKKEMANLQEQRATAQKELADLGGREKNLRNTIEKENETAADSRKRMATANSEERAQLLKAETEALKRRKLAMQELANVQEESQVRALDVGDLDREIKRVQREQFKGSRPWRNMALDDPALGKERKSVYGELETATRMHDAGCKPKGDTLNPEQVVLPEDVENAITARRGIQDIDHLYEPPDKTTWNTFAVESKTTGIPMPGDPVGRGELGSTNAGWQLSDSWLIRNAEKSGLKGAELKQFVEDVKAKRVRKIYSVTDPKNGTRFYEVDRVGDTDVKIGKEITSEFQKKP